MRRAVGDVLALLARSGQEAVVLTGRDPNRVVVVAPGLVGRVLCTGFDGVNGSTTSWIDEEQFRKGFTRPLPGASWANFGGEERIWFGPEGGPFGNFFPPGVEQKHANYLVQEAMNSLAYRVIDRAEVRAAVTFTAPVHLVNYQGTAIDLEVTRRVEVLDSCPFALDFGDKLETVGFQSQTWVKNTGARPLTRQTSAVCVWTLGIHPSNEHTVVVLPFHASPREQLGEPLLTQYFKTGTVDFSHVLPGRGPDDYWAVKERYALIKASGRVQTKLEMGPRRTLGRMASVDVADGTLTAVEFQTYPELDYPAPFWLPFAGDPFQGSALSVFVLGSWHDVEPFHELECFSPALFLQPGQEYCHTSRTWHLRGDRAALAAVCARSFFADPKTLEKFDRNSP
jgi:hypothetical protein